MSSQKRRVHLKIRNTTVVINSSLTICQKENTKEQKKLEKNYHQK